MPDAWEYPTPAFYFRVVFSSFGSSSDVSFQEVTGISSEMEMETVAEGGENRFAYQLPKLVKHPNLMLKRAIAPMDSELVQWCRNVLQGDFAVPIEPMVVFVHLMDECGVSIRSWMFDRAFPVKWEVDGFNSTKNEVAIEKIELSYGYCIREN